MRDLGRRVAAAERAMGRMQPGIMRVVIVNDPGGLYVDDGGSTPSHIVYRRLPDEAVESFRDRAAGDAEARGETMIFFGKQEARKRGFPIPKRRPPNQWLTLEAAAETPIVDPDCLDEIGDGL